MHNQKQDGTGTTGDPQGGNAAQGVRGYPLGRGYGHDYMRGGEVFGGYGYSDRPEYEQTRGEQKNSS